MPDAMALIIFGSIALGVLTFVARQNRAARHAFLKAAQLLRLPPTAVSGRLLFKLRGEVRGMQVGVREEQRGKSGLWTVIELDTGGRIPLDLELGREGILATLGKLFKGEDITTGDERFDKEVVVRGEPARALGLLDGETRSRVVELVQTDARVSDGRVAISLHKRFTNGNELADRMRAFVALAERLADPTPAPERLAGNARHDPVTDTRLANLRQLVADFPDHPLTTDTARAALEDRGPAVRFLAAVTLGGEGLDCLRSLVANRGTPASVALDAAHLLGDRLPEETALTRLEAATAAGHHELTHELVERLGTSPSFSTIDRLRRHLSAGPSALAVACAQALGRSGLATAEPALRTALSSPLPGLREAAAAALGPVGTVGAIPALRAIATSNGASAAERRAATGAIAAIQSRLSGAQPGQLALAGGGSGELSLVRAPSGTVSLADPRRESSIQDIGSVPSIGPAPSLVDAEAAVTGESLPKPGGQQPGSPSSTGDRRERTTE